MKRSHGNRLLLACDCDQTKIRHDGPPSLASAQPVLFVVTFRHPLVEAGIRPCVRTTCEQVLSFSSRMRCSQNRFCHTPHSRCLRRVGEMAASPRWSAIHCCVNSLLMHDQRAEKSPSFSGKAHMQCIWFGSSTIATMSNGCSACTAVIAFRKYARVTSSEKRLRRCAVTTVKKNVPPGWNCLR